MSIVHDEDPLADMFGALLQLLAVVVKWLLIWTTIGWVGFDVTFGQTVSMVFVMSLITSRFGKHETDKFNDDPVVNGLLYVAQAVLVWGITCIVLALCGWPDLAALVTP